MRVRLVGAAVGYDGVAIAHVVAGKLTPADVRLDPLALRDARPAELTRGPLPCGTPAQTPQQAYVNEARGGPAGGASRTLQVGPTQAGSTPAAPHRFSRLTLVLDTTTMNQQLVQRSARNGKNACPVCRSFPPPRLVDVRGPPRPERRQSGHDVVRSRGRPARQRKDLPK